MTFEEEELLKRIADALEDNNRKIEDAQCQHPPEFVEVTSRGRRDRVDLDCQRCRTRMSIGLDGIRWILKYKADLGEAKC